LIFKKTSGLNVHYFPYQLEFKKPFKIASVERLFTDNLYIKYSKDGYEGWGEAVFPPYIHENQQTAIKRLADLNWEFTDETELFRVIQKNQTILKHEPSLACAMESSLLNWLAASKKCSLNDVLELDSIEKETSFTIGMSSNIELEETIKNTPKATYFKLKVNELEIERIINKYKSITSKPFVVDANQGFKDFNKAKYWADKLYSEGVFYFEQPFHKDDFESHKRLRDSVEIPIVADESFQRFQDFDKVFDSFSGINVKITKTGGVLEAKKCLLKARSFGLKTIIGCMSGSSTSISTASSLVVLADFVDLDGVYLIKNDPNLELFKK
jgi:L-alanine-DL-glutamate epimerase-like enolase superfamily enzyme